MLTNEIKGKEYRKFFENGGYKIARLMVLATRIEKEEEKESYDIFSLLKWQCACEEDYYKLLENIQFEEIIKSGICYELIMPLEEIIFSLPRNWAETIVYKFAMDIKSSGNGTKGFRKRTVDTALNNCLKRICENDGSSGYNFDKEGYEAVCEINRKIEYIKSDNGYEYIEKAMQAMRFYKSNSSGNYMDAILEFCERFHFAAASYPKYKCKAEESSKKDRLIITPADRHFEENPSCEYRLYEKNESYIRFLKASQAPRFYFSKDFDIDIDRLEIIALPKDISGEKLELEIRDDVDGGKIILGKAPSHSNLYTYKLFRDGRFLQKADEPIFRRKNFIDGKYEIQAIKNEDSIGEKMVINNLFEKDNSALGNRTTERFSQNMNMLTFDILHNLEIIKNNIPEKYEKMLARKNKGKRENETEVFWELALMLFFPEI